MSHITTTILVLLYNKQLADSQTLRSLIHSRVDFSTCRLVIWNNGPSEILKHLDDCSYGGWQSIELVQTIENKPLSYIYNKLIDDYKSEYYIFLDDDSTLNDGYLEAVINNQNDVVVPEIYSLGVARSPTVDGNFSSGPFQVSDKVVAIGSGIRISHDIALRVKEYYGDVFDNRYAFYGVDTTFFLRLFHLKLSATIEVVNGFDHNMSRLEIESQTMSRFRKIERTLDLGLTLRHYMMLPTATWILIKSAIKLLLGRITWFYFWLLIKTYFVGYHPKCAPKDGTKKSLI